VVVLTGRRTYFGRTTELVATARPKLHVEAVVATLVRWLFLIVGTLLAVAFVFALSRGTPLLEMLPLMLVLLMSAVPVALPVMFTVSMAVGAMELARRGVLVTRLSAAEDAATMDVLCADKTGTVTMNRLSMADVLAGNGHTPAEVLDAAALASEEANQDPIDLAVLAAARTAHLPEAESTATRVSFTPFDPTTRRTEAIVELNGQRVRVTKGAAATVAAACRLDVPARAAVEARVRADAGRGYRVLGVARGPEAGPLTWLGLLTLSDPPPT
jgi:P-type E1-E2 ATPase